MEFCPMTPKKQKQTNKQELPDSANTGKKREAVFAYLQQRATVNLTRNFIFGVQERKP